MTPSRDPIAHIIAQIERGEITMRSKVRILAGTALVACAAAVVFVLSLYLISASVFTLRMSGVALFLSFGLRGVAAFLASFPWVLTGISLVLLVVLVRMVRLLPFAYRRSIVYSALAAIGVSATLGLVVEQTPLHAALNNRADTGVLRIVKPLYRQQRVQQVRHAYVGTVERVDAGVIELRTSAGIVRLGTDASTQYPKGPAVAPGQRVLILGDNRSGGLYARGIETIEDPAVFFAATLAPER